MYVLMDQRSPDRRASHQAHERHPKPMLRARAVMHSPANKESIRIRQSSIAQGGEEEKAGQQQILRRRQIPGQQQQSVAHPPIPAFSAHSSSPSTSSRPQMAIASSASSPRFASRQIEPTSRNRQMEMNSSMMLNGKWNDRRDGDAGAGGMPPNSAQLVNNRHVRYTSKVRPMMENRGREGDKKEQEEMMRMKMPSRDGKKREEEEGHQGGTIQNGQKMTMREYGMKKKMEKKTEVEEEEEEENSNEEWMKTTKVGMPDWKEKNGETMESEPEQARKYSSIRPGSLSRSKSQSRGTLLGRQDQFLLRGRSKTSSSLAVPTGGGTLARLRGGNRRRQQPAVLRQKPAFSGAQSAVIELFDASECQRRRDDWERGELRKGGQFGRVQRELRALAERRELGLGRGRRVRIADLLGVDQLLARGGGTNNPAGLQKPRKKPIQDYYNDDDAELEVMANAVDPSAPRPSGQLISPCRSDLPAGSPGLPRSIDSILFKWANTQSKAIATIQLDSHGKAATNLTYGKLLSRASKIAFALLNRQVTMSSPGGAKERVQLCVPGDRVALVYPNSEGPAFVCAFYGCFLAGVVPVPIEVPTAKRDAAGLQQFGFLLGSCGVRVALTSSSCLKGLPRVHQNGNQQGGGILLSSPPASSSSTGFSPPTGSPSSNSNAQNPSGAGAAQNPNDLADFKGWPRLQWLVTENLAKPSREWTLPSLLADDSVAYIEYSMDREGAVKGVSTSRQAMLAHSRALGAALDYKEGESLICVVDFKREAGLWHACIAAICHGMRVFFVPYSLMKVNPACWLLQATRHSAQHALVKSRDLHWSLMATRDHSQLQLRSLRSILITDGANPWSLSSCDQFVSVFKSHGLWHGTICPCAGSSEAGTVALRRPTRPGTDEEQLPPLAVTSLSSGSGRGILSMLALSHCVVRVDMGGGNSLSSLALQDTGQVVPGGMALVVKLNGPPRLCRADEVGEICLHAISSAQGFHGLQGLSQGTFSVSPLGADDKPLGPLRYVRTGLVGFLGPEGLIFSVGTKQSLLHVSGRVHSADDLIATVLAVEPMKFIYRGRISVFSVRVLRDERVCIVAEQRPEVNEEEAFGWMVRVLQAIDSIHQLGIYCLSLVPPNQLPKTPLGGIHVTECRQRFLEGCLHPSTLLMCPQNCVLNLPKPREPPTEVGPAAMFVGNIVQGCRIAEAQGRELPYSPDECIHLAGILRQRAQHTPDHVLFSLLNSRAIEVDSLTCGQLLKRAERIAALLLERGRLAPGDHVALIFPPGLDLIAAVFGCFCASLVPVSIRPPSPQNLHTSMLTVRMIVDVSKAVALLSNSALIKLLKSKEVSHRVNTKAWPTILDIEDAPSLSVARNRARRSAESATTPTREPTDICYLDFAVSTTGQLSGVLITAQGAANQCKSLKVASELYPSRNVTLCLDPCSGLGFTLWCLSSVYSGHQSTLIPPLEMEQNSQVWLQVLTQNKSRDTFCSNSIMELCVRELAPVLGQLRERGMNLSSLRNCIVVAEERPRVQLCNAFIKLFAPLGLSARAVSTAFGCRVNPAICMQGAASPDPSTVFVDARALRNDRVTLVEKGAPHSICLMESGKLLPGVRVAIANPKTLGQCADTHLGEIWVASGHNAAGFFSIFGEETRLQTDHFNARLSTGDTKTIWARTGYLGFLRQTQAITANGELHDALFVVGAMDETMMLRGMRYHPVDIELAVNRAHRQICESAAFTWTHLLVIVAETNAPEAEALDLVPAITSAVLEEQHLIVGVVVVVDPGMIPMNSRGEKQRTHLRELFLKDQLDPIYVSYNL